MEHVTLLQYEISLINFGQDPAAISIYIYNRKKVYIYPKRILLSPSVLIIFAFHLHLAHWFLSPRWGGWTAKVTALH